MLGGSRRDQKVVSTDRDSTRQSGQQLRVGTRGFQIERQYGDSGKNRLDEGSAPYPARFAVRSMNPRQKL